MTLPNEQPEKDLRGFQFGMLTYIHDVEPKRSNNALYQYGLCKCIICGVEVTARVVNLQNGTKYSCGTPRCYTAFFQQINKQMNTPINSRISGWETIRQLELDAIQGKVSIDYLLEQTRERL